MQMTTRRADPRSAAHSGARTAAHRSAGQGSEPGEGAPQVAFSTLPGSWDPCSIPEGAHAAPAASLAARVRVLMNKSLPLLTPNRIPA